MVNTRKKWTEDELNILMLCVKSKLTRSATIDYCVKEGIMRSDGAISKKRLELKRNYGTMGYPLEAPQEMAKDIDEVIDIAPIATDWPVEKRGLGLGDFLFLALATAATLWVLTEGNYIDWS